MQLDLRPRSDPLTESANAPRSLPRSVEVGDRSPPASASSSTRCRCRNRRARAPSHRAPSASISRAQSPDQLWICASTFGRVGLPSRPRAPSNASTSATAARCACARPAAPRAPLPASSNAAFAPSPTSALPRARILAASSGIPTTRRRRSRAKRRGDHGAPEGSSAGEATARALPPRTRRAVWRPRRLGTPRRVALSSARARQRLAPPPRAADARGHRASRCSPSNVPEQALPGEAPAQLARRLAPRRRRRWRAAVGPAPRALVLGADTIVVIDGDVLGKPDDAEHAVALLAAAGRPAHCVLTGGAARRERHASSPRHTRRGERA